MSNKIIDMDSDEAAKPHVANGYLSSRGNFFMDEAAARYDGCTHVKCRHCGEPAQKSYLACDKCRDKDGSDKFYAMPEAKWDGIAMLYSDTRDQYYNTPEDAYDDVADGDDISELRLIICEPNFVRPLDGDYCCDELAEDMDVPAKVAEAMDVFNHAVSGIILSWSPGKNRLNIEGGAA